MATKPKNLREAAEIAERYGFQPEKVEVVEASLDGNELQSGIFRVCGRGYSFCGGLFGLNPAYDA